MFDLFVFVCLTAVKVVKLKADKQRTEIFKIDSRRKTN